MTSAETTRAVAHRPRLHFTPPRHWMNDPNGLLSDDAGWRLWFQYAEDAPDYRQLHWATAASPDLLHWRHEGVALPAAPDLSRYSGCVVRAPDGRLLAFHTANRTPPGAPRRQTQELAVGVDDGRRLVPHPGPPLVDEGLADFRDPYVFRHGDGWSMVVAKPAAWEAETGGAASRLALYRSDDLATWRPAGGIGPWESSTSVWEVPWLVPVALPGRAPGWLLALSVVDRSDGGQRSGTRAWLGDFDGAGFVPLPCAPQTLDHGPDYYAPIPASGSDASTPGSTATTIAWVGNWAYARRLPVAPWAGGALALPRRLDVVATRLGPRVRQRFLPALDSLTEGAVATGCALCGAEPEAIPVPRAPYLVDLVIDAGEVTRFSLALYDGALALGVEDAGRRAFMERADRPAGLGLAGRWTATRVLAGPVRLRIVVDTVVIAASFDDGLAPFTALVFPEGPPAPALRLAAAGGGARVEWRVAALRPTQEG